MAKKTLNLTIEERIKERAKRIAESRGISVSRLFEEAIAREEEPKEFTPRPGSALEQIMNAIPESQKMDDYDYDELKSEALKLRWPDFEDAIHYRAALSAGCDAIVTRNPGDFKEAGLTVLTPPQLLDDLDDKQ